MFSSMVHPHTLSYQDLVSRALVGQIWAFHVNSFHHVSDGLCQTHTHTNHSIPDLVSIPPCHNKQNSLFRKFQPIVAERAKTYTMKYVFLMVGVSTQFMSLNSHYHHNAKQCMAIWRVYIAYVRHGTQFDYHKHLVTLRHSDPSCWAIPLLINILENKG